MTRDEFEERLRTLVRRRLFQPFTVVLLTGERVEVDLAEAVAWGGGLAGFLKASGEPVWFDCTGVQEFVEHAPEATS